MQVIKGKKPCTAQVYCVGMETDGKDDNVRTPAACCFPSLIHIHQAVIKGGHLCMSSAGLPLHSHLSADDQTLNTYRLANSWGWLAYNYPAKSGVCKITAKQWAKM
jgi:hypothetical protein